MATTSSPHAEEAAKPLSRSTRTAMPIEGAINAASILPPPFGAGWKGRSGTPRPRYSAECVSAKCGSGLMKRPRHGLSPRRTFSVSRYVPGWRTPFSRTRRQTAPLLSHIAFGDMGASQGPHMRRLVPRDVSLFGSRSQRAALTSPAQPFRARCFHHAPATHLAAARPAARDPTQGRGSPPCA